MGSERFVVDTIAALSNAVLKLRSLVRLEFLLLLQECCAILLKLLTLWGDYVFLSFLIVGRELIIPALDVCGCFFSCGDSLCWVWVIQSLRQVFQRSRQIVRIQTL